MWPHVAMIPSYCVIDGGCALSRRRSTKSFKGGEFHLADVIDFVRDGVEVSGWMI